MPGALQAGDLNRRITVSRATLSPNLFNEPEETWLTYAVLYAKKDDASAGESYRAQEVGAEISARFTVRWSSLTAAINPRDRITFAGVEYNITGIRDVGVNTWREIDAVARAQSPAVITEGSP
jgi:SPP1 family predicted phage head-tail adaptor